MKFGRQEIADMKKQYDIGFLNGFAACFSILCGTIIVPVILAMFL